MPSAAERPNGSRLASVMADGSEPMGHLELENRSVKLARLLSVVPNATESR